jgi:hypothetical protein
MPLPSGEGSATRRRGQLKETALVYRLRKLVGALLLLVLLPLYVLFAIVLAATLLPGASLWAQFGYYLIAGLLWVFPAALIVSWLFRPPRRV